MNDYVCGGVTCRELGLKYRTSDTTVLLILNEAGVDVKANRIALLSATNKIRMIGNDHGKGNKGHVMSAKQRQQVSDFHRGRKQSRKTKNRRATSLAKVNYYKPTKIELVVQDVLNDIGVEYVVHKVYLVPDGQKLVRIVPDIYVPSIDTIIEVNGCYWHECELCYPEKVRTDGRWERDQIRNNLLLTKVEAVYVIWQHELDQPVEAVEAALDHIRWRDQEPNPTP